MKTEFANNALKSAIEVRDAIAPERAAGKTLVTTNGCFDIIHAGHVQYLSEASRLGDILVVGINSDAVVRKLKGSTRPLQNENDRVRIMASLRMVDFSFIFCEDDPRAFLEILRPNVHVKGGDYSLDILEKPIVEKHGGRIQIVSFLPNHSTSSIVAKVNNANQS